MLKRFLPKQNKFFNLFQQTAELLVSTTREFHHLLTDPRNQQQHVNKIAEFEEKADIETHKTFALLHKTFITPFDRHDIYYLASGMDDIIDSVNRCAQRFPFYSLTIVPDNMVTLAKYSEQSSILLKNAIYCLPTLNKATEIFRYCDHIDETEKEAHQIVLAGEKKLFLEENNFKEFFKLKDIYTQTKAMINRCQDVSNIIKGIVLEYS